MKSVGSLACHPFDYSTGLNGQCLPVVDEYVAVEFVRVIASPRGGTHAGPIVGDDDFRSVGERWTIALSLQRCECATCQDCQKQMLHDEENLVGG